MRSRFHRLAATALVGVPVLLFSASASAATVGSLPATAGSSAGSLGEVIGDETFPAAGSVDSFSFRYGGRGGHADLQVLRAGPGANQYQVIGEVPATDNGTPGTVVTLPVSPAIQVHAGDLLGIYVTSGAFSTSGTSAGSGRNEVFGAISPEPTTGSSFTFNQPSTLTDEVHNLTANAIATPPPTPTTASSQTTAQATVGSALSLSGGGVNYGTIVPTIGAATYPATSSLSVSTSSATGVDVSVSASGSDALGIPGATQTVTSTGFSAMTVGTAVPVVHATAPVNGTYTSTWSLLVPVGAVLLQGAVKQQTLTYTATAGL